MLERTSNGSDVPCQKVEAFAEHLASVMFDQALRVLPLTDLDRDKRIPLIMKFGARVACLALDKFNERFDC